MLRVVDATKGYVPFPLPATSFSIVPGTMPLIVDESPVEERDAVYKVSAEKAGKNDDRDGGGRCGRQERGRRRWAGTRGRRRWAGTRGRRRCGGHQVGRCEDAGSPAQTTEEVTSERRPR